MLSELIQPNSRGTFLFAVRRLVAAFSCQIVGLGTSRCGAAKAATSRRPPNFALPYLEPFSANCPSQIGLTFTPHQNIVRPFSIFEGRLILTSLIHQSPQSRIKQPSVAQIKLPTIAKVSDNFAIAKFGW
jgi:hypothetical protein